MRVSSIIDSVGQGGCKNSDGTSYWDTTAIFITWDDWGGFYDHVQPYEVLINTATPPNCAVFGCGYVSGFRVPLLVVSAYTPAGYVSGSWSGQGSPPVTCPILTEPKYCHDFGSILAFIEYNFLGTNGIGAINPQYQFADAFAPDRVNGTNIPLSDFFPIPQNHPRQFVRIVPPPGAPSVQDFLNYKGPFTDPDNDVIDND